MHHCLHIEEILATIFEFVLYDVGTRKTYDKRSVLALVKTCRTFNMPALQVLWTNLFSPVPLLLTLPDDLWQVEGTRASLEPRTFSFKREIRPDDWTRFDFYASFVRHLGVTEMYGQSSTSSISFDDGVRGQLESRIPAVSLLPNLRTIIVRANDLPLTSLFLSRRVHELRLVMLPTQAAALSSLAREIPLRSPTLRSLSLVQNGFWNISHKAQFIDALVGLLGHLQLEEFICDWFPLSEDMLRAVLAMPYLSSVVMYAAMPDLAKVMHDHGPIQDARIRLFSLHTHLLVPSHLPHIISSLRPSKLEALAITARRDSCNTTKELTDLISTVVTTCSPHHFTELTIDYGRRDGTESAAATIDFKMLKPFLPFVHLKRISLPAHPFDLTDLEVKELAMAWPNLEDLCFWAYQYTSAAAVPGGSTTTGGRGNSASPRTSLRGLLWLATHCRKLNNLTFPFRSVSIGEEILTEDEMALAQGHGLDVLDVGFSEIQCAERVAAFINRVFPDLKLFLFRVGEPYYERWEKVQELIQC